MEHLLRHIITIYTTSKNKFNEEVFDQGENARARFQLKTALIQNELNEAITADAHIYVDRVARDLTIGTKIVYNGIDYRIVALKQALDYQSNVHHYELWVKRFTR